MKICYIADGSSIHTQRWLNYFAQKGHEVHLLSPTPTAGEGFAKGVQLHLLVRLIPRIWPLTRYFSGLAWLVQIRRLVSRIKPDILDAHGITVNGYLGVASGFHPLVLSAWGSDILIDPKHNLFFRAVTKYALKRANVVIHDSQTVKEELIKLGTKPEKLSLIFWGVDTQQFNPYQRDKHFKGRLGLPEAPTIICIRSLRAVYNVEMLVRAIPFILKQAPEVTFIIGGDGEQRDYLKNMANSLGVLDSIRFAGWIPHDELPKYLASSDIYVSTSLSDGTSLSLQEAMACKLAPVVTDLPANREWVKDGVNGFVAPVDDVPALADRIMWLVQNKDVREKFGEVGRKIIQERAEYKQAMGKMERIYQGLLER